MEADIKLAELTWNEQLRGPTQTTPHARSHLILTGMALKNLGMEKFKFLFPDHKEFTLSLYRLYQDLIFDTIGISFHEVAEVRRRGNTEHPRVSRWWSILSNSYKVKDDPDGDKKKNEVMLTCRLGGRHAKKLIEMWDGSITRARTYFNNSLHELEQSFGECNLRSILAESNFDVEDAKVHLDEIVTKVVSMCFTTETDALRSLGEHDFIVDDAISKIQEDKISMLVMANQDRKLSTSYVRSCLVSCNWDEVNANTLIQQRANQHEHDANIVSRCNVCFDELSPSGNKRQVSVCRGQCYESNAICFDCAMEINRREYRPKCPFCKRRYFLTELHERQGG